MSNIFIGSLPDDLPCVSVLMAGGSGTRFWPLSRTHRPKQFLPLAGGSSSLLQATAERVEPLSGKNGVLVVTAQHQSSLVVEQLPQAAVLNEPAARNTAACLGYAAVKVLTAAGDVPMVCLPSDHIIHGNERILDLYRQGCEIAAGEDALITFGIRPTSPETGYGYIKCGTIRTSEGGEQYVVERFVEKPDRAAAEQYLSEGGYFWNSGMFVWRPSVLLAAIERHVPELYTVLDKIGGCFGRPDEYERISELYSSITPVSIDVAVMERASNVIMLPGDGFTWSDVGSWSSWSETRSSDADQHGNVVQGEAILVESRNTTIMGSSRLIAAVGAKDLIVVDTHDAVLVCHRDRSQDVREVVEQLKKDRKTDLL